MLMRRVVFFALLAFLPLSSPRAETKAPPTVKPFTLTGSDGKEWSFAAHKDAKAIAVVFLGTECPVNNQYLPELARLHKTYAAKSVVLVGINSNVHDTATRVRSHAEANALPFPVLKDTGNVVADDFGAKRTPEAFVLSPKGEVLYRGRIDDQIGIGFRRKTVGRHDLAEALDETLDGKAVSVATTEAPGCLIARAIKPKADGAVTFTKHVAKVLQNRCQECHRTGQVAPMPLVSFEDAVSWSEMIREVVSEGRMPPWHADPKHGKFSNDRSMPKEDRDTLLAWIKDGCPKGDAKDMPAAKKWEDGWMIGKPDLILQMPTAYEVPAEMPKGGVKYQKFIVPTNFAEDRWIERAETRPGAREVVHHIIIYVVDAKGKRPSPGDGIGNGFLTSYAPGDSPLILQPGQAKKLPKGAVLVFQMHYTPDGVKRTDRSSVALTFAKEEPKVEVRTRAITQQLFLIPPGANNVEVVSSAEFKQDVELLTFFPHMHVRGKDFKYVVQVPGRKEETVLSVPRYDFNWQANYRLTEPMKLPKGTKIRCTAHFDNSKDNPNNPDPTKWVRWGEQTWEEMMIGFVDYAMPIEEKK
jgi:peroxiredoxin